MKYYHTNESYTSLGNYEINNGLIYHVRHSRNKDEFVLDIYRKKTSSELHEGGQEKHDEEETKIKKEIRREKLLHFYVQNISL